MNPTVTLVEVSLDDVVAGLKSILQSVTWAGYSATWGGQPYRYDRKSRMVSWVPSGAITAETWAAAIVQGPATATVRNIPQRTAWAWTPKETKDRRSWVLS
jgi:hypothetical protein